jgi:N-acetylmuramoyl-L-alanine amidase
MPPDAGSIKELTTNSSKWNSEIDYNAAGIALTRYLADSARHNSQAKKARAEVRKVTASADTVSLARSPAQNQKQLWANVKFNPTATARIDFADSAAHAKPNPSFGPSIERREPTNPSWISRLKSGELNGKRIVIDAGHGGSEGGATYGGVSEKDITLEMAKLVADGLRRRGAEVIMTRDSDKSVDLGTRYQLTRQERPDAFLSLHCNASPRGEDESAYGIQTHFYAPKSAQYARVLSTALSNKLSESTLTVNNRGTFDRENSDFYVLKNQNIPSALVELGFVSNRRERNLLSDPAYRQRLADALISAEVNYLTQPAKPELLYGYNSSNSSARRAGGRNS